MRITRFLTKISVFCAWLLVILAILGAALFPVIGTTFARMEKATVSSWVWFPVSALLLIVAMGGYLLIRRKPLGLLLVALPAIQLFTEVNTLAALAYLGIVLLIFGTPIVLANNLSCRDST